MLELKNICYEADGKKILDNINLTLNERFIAITGPNGGGKSTLAKIIMGILKPTQGQIFFDGIDITDYTISQRAKMGISYAFQKPVAFKGLTVKDLLKLAYGRETNINELCEVLSEVGLCARDYITRELNDTLSGGEMKRIEIATILARKTKLSLFDEPEAGIDLWSFQNLIHVFENMYKKTKGSIIIISHQERILNIADKVVLLKDGKTKKFGSKEEVLPDLFSNNSTGVCSKLIDKMNNNDNIKVGEK
ncbi:MAG: ATP-binding cassette domain-containing protein [Acutalibacteraceae bacterium]|nr:ATP-binding cassette domain-containing protein [Acutalibacteraceae bacterium]